MSAAGADDPDRLAAVALSAQRRYPAFLPSLVREVAFDRADGDGAVAGLLDDAIAFTQAVLGTDAAAHLGHGAGGLGQLIGLADTPFGGHPQPVGDVVVQGTMGLAEGHAALRAPRRLLGRLGVDEVGIDFVEVASARLHVTLFRHGALE